MSRPEAASLVNHHASERAHFVRNLKPPWCVLFFCATFSCGLGSHVDEKQSQKISRRNVVLKSLWQGVVFFSLMQSFQLPQGSQEEIPSRNLLRLFLNM